MPGSGSGKGKDKTHKGKTKGGKKSGNTPRTMLEPQFALRGVLRVDNAREMAHVLYRAHVCQWCLSSAHRTMDCT